MAWQTIGTTNLTNSRGVVGYVYLQYDDSSSGSNWNVRLITGARSGWSFDVQFNNIVVDGSSPTTVYHVTQNSVVVWSGSLSGGRTISGSWSCPWDASWGGTRSYTISGTLPSKGTAPTKPYATYNSSTWDSVTFTTGMESNGGQKVSNHAIMITGSSNGDVVNYTTLDVAPRWEWLYDGTYDLSHQFVATQATADQSFYSPIAIKGLLNYKLAVWVANDYGSVSTVNQTVRYLPPAPLQSITYTQTQNSTNVTVNFTVTGGNSSNNYSDTVTTYYRYSTNNGSSYSPWESIGTGTPWTAKSGSFTCAYNSSVVIQAKQTYHDRDSKVEQVSFTASGTAPSGGTLSVTGATWNTITLAVSGVNYGKPDAISGRKLAIGVRDSAVSPTAKRENQVANTTSATTTVNNNSIYPSSQPLNLRGMLPVYPYIWAWNTIYAAMTYIADSPYYLPPAPGQLSYTDPGGVGSKTYPVEFTGVAANNYADYDQSELTRTVRYKVGSGEWTVVENASVVSLTTVTSFNVTVPAGSTATVEAYMTYRGQQSEVSTMIISNSSDPIHIYGSINGEAVDTVKWYGSVNGETVKISKIYGSYQGVARKVFEDGN